MAFAMGIRAIHPSGVANRSHVVGFTTPRSAANDTLFEVWNSDSVTGIRAAIDKDGKYYSNALTAGDILYAVVGGVANVRRLDSLAIGAANTVLTSTGSAPQWSATIAYAALPTGGGTWANGGALSITGGVTTVAGLTSSALVTASAGLTVASGQTLTVTGATITGLTAASVAAGTFPAGTFSITTLTVTGTLTLTGATITGAPAWGSTQAMSISGNAATATSATSATTATTAGTCSGNAATATALQTARTIGGVSFNGAADVTVASATGGFTVSGGNLALGANSLTMTGSIGATGARVTKGWFTDLEVTNAIAGSVTGTAATVTGAAQAAITSVGTLTGLTINGNLTFTGAGRTISGLDGLLVGSYILMDATPSPFIAGGSVSLVFRANDAATSNVTITDAGAVTIHRSGLVVGSATGGNKGLGSINVAGDIYKNNLAYGNPDYVFELAYLGRAISPIREGYRPYLPLAAVEVHTREHFCLPGMDRKAGLFTAAGILEEKIEEGYLYLFDHERRIGANESRIEALEAENAGLRAELALLRN